MRVENNIAVLGAQQKKNVTAMEQTNRRLSTVLEKLATGNRINRARDDAAGLAISEGLISQSRGFRAATRNVQDAVSAYNIADGASNETANILQRQRELAAQARNATLNAGDREVLNREFQQLNQEIERISDSTNFNRLNLTNGQGFGDGNAQVQAGSDGNEMITAPQIDLSVQALGMLGTDISTIDGANAAFASVDSAINAVSEQRSTIGAMTNRLESTIRNLQTADVNTTAAQSVIRDQDMALGIAEMVKNQLLEETSRSAFSIFNRISADHILGLIR